MVDLEARVLAHPFVDALRPGPLGGLVAAAAGVVEWPAEAIVARTGTVADRCFLVERGDLAVEVHRPGRPARILQTVNDGEVLGWSWLVEPFEWSFDVRALTPTTAIALDGLELREAIEADHELGYVVLRGFAGVIAGRLEAARLQILDVYGTHD